MMRKLTLAAAALSTLALASPASASVIVLDFENVAPSYPNGSNTLIQEFYNGGTSSAGTSGTNFGVSFSSNSLAICLNTPGVQCSNTSHGGLNPGSEFGGLFFLSGSESFMTVLGGFDTGFSFLYTAINQAGSVSVYDGVNGTGNILATLALPITSSDCGGIYSAGFCPFTPVGVSFSGTAQSVSFAGVANQIVIDDITFGSAIVGGAVPEPATWMMLLLGFFAMGGILRRDKRYSQSLTVTYS